MKSCGHLDKLNRLQEELKLFATTNEPGKVTGPYLSLFWPGAKHKVEAYIYIILQLTICI
jgi:hypothetical protein